MERFIWKGHKDIFKGVGIYHITFVIRGRKPLLGHLAIDHDEPRCIPSDWGRAISHDLDHIQQRRPYVRLLAKQLMPDHIHVLLYITDDCGTSIKEVARGMRQGWRQIMPASVRIDPQMTSAEGYKQMPEGGMQPPLFEPPFYRTLSRRGQLQAMIAYIHDNPRRSLLRRRHPDLFILRRDTQACGLRFSSLGNLFLLDYPDKHAVICSRSLSAGQIAGQQEAAIDQARQGAIIVTAAISPGEKQIARAVREAGFPVIILLKDGFPKAGDERERYYKPGGVYFNACASGRLLLLEPTAETMASPDIQTRTEQTLREKAEARHLDYQPIPVTSERYRMMAANEMVKQLCV